MDFVGVIDSEETFGHTFPDGNRIYVEMSEFVSVPEEQAMNPYYWLNRYNNGDFECEDAPMVWLNQK